MSDLFGNHIVGFPTRRLICDRRCYINQAIPNNDGNGHYNVILHIIRNKILCTLYEDGPESSVIDVITLLMHMIGCCIIP